MEIVFEDMRVPKDCVLWEAGKGFEIAQRRLGPGRIHHCMRAIGQCERALALMCKRADTRVAFGKPLAKRDTVPNRRRPFGCKGVPLLHRERRLLSRLGVTSSPLVAEKSKTASNLVSPSSALHASEKAIRLQAGW